MNMYRITILDLFGSVLAVYERYTGDKGVAEEMGKVIAARFPEARDVRVEEV